LGCCSSSLSWPMHGMLHGHTKARRRVL
jgi:hypothetical protein